MAVTINGTTGVDQSQVTGATKLPSGTTAQRPGSPAEGYTRYNTDTDFVEVYANGAWVNVGDMSTIYEADYLIAAGGGGGGCANGGGGAGGAGGLLASRTGLSTGTTYTITVGAGGAGGAITNSGQPGVQGTNSSIVYTTSITAIGGGYGGGDDGSVGGEPGGSGGSGGGGSRKDSNAGGSGTSGQGNDGGDASPSTNVGGGGGGAGAVGQNATNTDAGDGGIGAIKTIISSSIATAQSVGEVSGSDVYFSGGGGGGIESPSTSANRGLGGLGGGGDGGAAGSVGTAPTAGTANTGGGGGASGDFNTGGSYPGQQGGSGVVILKIPTARYSGTITGSPSVVTDGSNTILIYKSSGTYTA